MFAPYSLQIWLGEVEHKMLEIYLRLKIFDLNGNAGRTTSLNSSSEVHKICMV